jgi:hypothetical protein
MSPVPEPRTVSETGIMRMARNAARVARKPWHEHVLVLLVIVSGAAVTAEVIPPGPWAKMVAGVTSGLYAWGYLRRPT